VGLGSWLAKRNGANPAVRNVHMPDPVIAAMLGFSPGTERISISEHSAMNLSAVFRAGSLVSGSIGSLPLRTIEQASNGTSKRSRSFLDNVGGDRFTPVEWAELSMIHLLLHGNAYLQHLRNGSGQLAALHPIHPLAVTTEWDDSRPGGKVFKVGTGDGKTEKLDASSCTQVMGLSLDGLTGLSVITIARMSLGGALAGDRTAARMQTNGAMISGVLTPTEDDQFEEEDAKAAQASISQAVSGPEHAGDIVVLNQALKFQPWQLSAVDAQFLESRTFSIDEIGRWFGVPPHLLGLTEKSTSWGQGIAEQNRGLARYTLQPWTNRIEQRLTRLIPPGRKAQFDYAQFVEPSLEDKIGLILQQVNGGFLTPNEGRRLMDLPPIAGGDVLRTPVGGTPPEDDEEADQ
jgi:HK97 family phage portal protein